MAALSSIIVLFFLVAGVVCADTGTQEDRPPDHGAVVDRLYEENLRRHKGNKDILVLPGLVADRRDKSVWVQARTTDLGENDPVEFFLIAETSGHAYEALAVSFALPSDIHKALLFIGMTPGSPVNRRELRFWPKGERVLMSFRYGDALSGPPSVRAERLLLDRRTGRPLVPRGLVFVGSFFTEQPETSGEKVYAADRLEPHSIASSYNEATTVFDVPRQEWQSDVYGSLTPNPEQRLPAGDLIDVLIEPEHKDGTRRVAALRLDVQVGPPGKAQGVAALVLHLVDGEGRTLNSATHLNGVLEELNALADQDRDVFLSLKVDSAVPLGALRELCVVLSSIETERGVRVDPPLPGHLYYKALLPDEKHRDREQRISQPWELHLRAQGKAVGGRLVHIEQIWPEDALRPDLKATEWEVEDPGALRRELNTRGPGMPVILVFTRSELPHGALMHFLDPVLSTHGTIHVFLETAPASSGTKPGI